MRSVSPSKSPLCWFVVVSFGGLCSLPAVAQINSPQSKQNEPPKVLGGTLVNVGRAGIVIEENGKTATISINAQTTVEVRWKANSKKLTTGQWVEVSGTLTEGGRLKGGLTSRAADSRSPTAFQAAAGHLRDGSLTVVAKSKRPLRPTIVGFPYSPDTDLKLSFRATVSRLQPLTVRPMEQLALISDAQKLPVGNTGATRTIVKYDKLLPFSQYTVQLIDPTTVNVLSHDLKHAVPGARTIVHLDEKTRRVPVKVVVINPDLPEASDQEADGEKKSEGEKKKRRRGRRRRNES